MTLDKVQAFPLEQAYLCADCHTVCNTAAQCPSCAGVNGLLSLSTVLNREERSEEHGEDRSGEAAGLRIAEYTGPVDTDVFRSS